MTIYRHAIFAVLAASLLAPVLATAAESACKYVEVARLPLRYTGPSLQITTEGSINGTPATMLVDTGASSSALTRAATARHKLLLRNTGREVVGIGGSAWIYQTRVDEFTIGPARIGRAHVEVLNDFGHTPSFEAVVGAPFLMQSDLEISLATKELKFFRPKDCGSAFLGYWDPNAVVLPFSRTSRTAGNPHFTVVVNGVKLDAVIDTGATSSFVTLNAAKRAGLKLDAPGVTRTADAVGVGASRAATWRTTFTRFEIGDEVVHNAQVGVLDYEGVAEVLLGADFLRSHRVLFAMSQEKIYLSYIGGEPFGQWQGVEPWVYAEAEAGNADAQMVLSHNYMHGKRIPRHSATALQWLEKAARGGNAEANIVTGQRMMLAGQYAQAASHLRAGVDTLHVHDQASLWLYLARLRSGQPELAKTELAAARARNRHDEWPAPIVDFYLGKLDAAKLLDEARDDRKLARQRTCQSMAAMAEWHNAHGDTAAVAALAAQRAGEGCPAAPMAGSKAGAAPVAAPVPAPPQA